MVRSHLAATLCAGLVLFASPMSAQSVSAEVVVRSRPVAGRVVVGDRYRTREYRDVVLVRRVPARRVYLESERPRIIIVERFPKRGPGWRHHRGYRMVTVYYVHGRYYDRYDRRYPGLERVVVYERDGHYYRDN